MNFFDKPQPALYRWRWPSLLVLSAVCCCLFFWRAWQSNPQQTLARAQDLLSDDKPAAALAELMPVLKQLPPNGDASFCAGQASTRLNQWKIATSHFLKVPPDHPLRAEACFRAADLYLLKLLQLSAAERLLTESHSVQAMPIARRNDSKGEVPGLRSVATAIGTPAARSASIGGSFVSRSA